MPIYFYRVEEYLTTFGLDKDKTEPFSYIEEFRGTNLLECRERAYAFYNDRRKGLEAATYFLPLAAYKDFKDGENAACMHTLSLIEYHNADEEYEYFLEGWDENEQIGNRQIEREILQDYV